MTDGNNEKPQTDAQASRALAQQLGKLAALVLLVIVALLIERYCSHKPSPFGPGVKIVSIDGDTLRAGDGSEYRIFGIDAPELHQTCKEAIGKSWACGRAAKARLTTLIEGNNVNCTARDKDRFRPDRGSMQRGRSARSWRCQRARAMPSTSGARRAIRTIRPRSRHKRASAAYGAAPSRGRQTGAWPIHARTNRPRRSLRRLRFGLS